MEKVGKRFEGSFIKSIKDKHPEYYIKRLKDDTSGYAGVHNECDFLIFTGIKLCLLELKTTKQKSLPLTNIADWQISGLLEQSSKQNIIAGLVINYREYDNHTYFLPIQAVDSLIKNNTRKSISMDYCNEYGIEIHNHLIRVNYRYDIDDFFDVI